MSNLAQLADHIKARNAIDAEIAMLVGRPALPGHIGEYIAASIFNIELMPSASHRGSDGVFREGELTGKSVNIKWYQSFSGCLDMTPNSLPDYYLVMTGPKRNTASSKGIAVPMSIASVFLFDASALVAQLQTNNVKVGTETSVRKVFWDAAEIYPNSNSPVLSLSLEQRAKLALFNLPC